MTGARNSTTVADPSQRISPSFHGVQYQVTGVPRPGAFYTERLGFALDHQQSPAFAGVSLGPLRVLLSGPGASGSRRMPESRPDRRD